MERKNLSFDENIERHRITVNFLSLIKKRQSDFVADLVYTFLHENHWDDLSRIDKKFARNIADYAKYGVPFEKRNAPAVDISELLARLAFLMNNSGQSTGNMSSAPQINKTSHDDFPQKTKKPLAEVFEDSDAEDDGPEDLSDYLPDL